MSDLRDGARPGSTPVDRILDALGADAAPIVLIDGFSGAGKSTLGDLLVDEWADRRGIRPALVRLELIYPGWDGLDAASDVLLNDILTPLSRGETGSWRRWDWTAGAPAERHLVPADTPLVVEGVGALTRRNRVLAALGVWVDLDERTRRRRALDRDGDSYRHHWDRWAAQERVFSEREHPHQVADLRFDGTALSDHADLR